MPSRGAPWFPVRMIHPLVAPMVECEADRDQTTPITRSGYLPLFLKRIVGRIYCSAGVFDLEKT